jgi:rSAM/selenodomain-associated transferase 2/rSAM/selenodomain-associated transferase 1
MLKHPQPGRVKTRLIPALGVQRACDLCRALADHTLEAARRFMSETGASVQVRVAGAPSSEKVREWVGAECSIAEQGEGDLGQRMELATREAFQEGAAKVVIIGADCPELGPGHLRAAFEALESKDAVLGPAADGGYYLVGMRVLAPEVFRGIAWSTESVLTQTLAAFRGAGIDPELLETLHDIDIPEDLVHWAKTAAAREAGRGKISVIIPALNESAHLRRTLEAAQTDSRVHEIILVDGGSDDETTEIARAFDCIVLAGPRGRAKQMNLGSSIATGEHLLFLHADTLLPRAYAAHIFDALAEANVIAGAFQFAVADDFRGRKLVERATNWRARVLQLPYGDQGLFVLRTVYDRMGGFADIPIMEDYDFVRRLRRHGRIAIAPAPAVTSGRRWQRLGMLRTTLANAAIIAAFHLGVSPMRLAQWYRPAATR